jgi:hypothetical protein
MKIKFIIILLSLFFLFPTISNAAMVPFLNVAVTKNTVGGDGVFDFRAYDQFMTESFQIETEDGEGFYSHLSMVNPGDEVRIVETIQPGWKFGGVSCFSSNPDITTEPIENGILIIGDYFSSISCVFNNIKIEEESKNPVLIVPGLVGTEMKKVEELLWADVGRMMNPLNDDSFMDPLSFAETLMPIDGDISLVNILSSKTVGPVKYDYFEGVINEFVGQGYAEDELLFTFPYDWRYGVSGVMPDGKTNVILLGEKINEILQQTGANKVDVVAHSMGGLLVKKYAMDNLGSHNIDKTVFVGVPSTGTPKSVKVLTQGDNFGVLGLNDQEIKKIAKNMPASYDLLPSQKYYSDNGSFIKTINIDVGQLVYEEKDLNYQETKSFLTDSHSLNSLALDNSSNLHSDNFSNFDMRTAGIDFYAINGCKSATVNKIIETTHKNIFGNETKSYKLEQGTGDGTVVLGSANSVAIDNSNLFYAIKSNHGKMMSQEGVRQQIVNLISESSLDTQNKIISKNELDSNPSQCQLTGNYFSFLSPVLPEVIDQNGNRIGVAEDGSIENNIPGADYNIMGEQKFVFIPTDENQNYIINFKGTDLGEFTVKNEQITAGQSIKTEVFSNLPVSSDLVGQVILAGNSTTLSLDNDGNGTVDEVLEPSSVLLPEEADDFLPPKTKVVLTGKEHKDGSFISDVLVELKAEDDVSGVLETLYSLDGVNFKEYIEPFVLEKRNVYKLYYYSIDKAGNIEEANVLEIKVGVRQKKWEKCWENGKCPKITKIGKKIILDIKNIKKEFVKQAKETLKDKIIEKINIFKSKLKKR